VHYKQEQCVSLFFLTGKSHVRHFCCLKDDWKFILAAKEGEKKLHTSPALYFGAPWPKIIYRGIWKLIFFPICPQNSVLITLGWLLSDQYNVYRPQIKSLYYYVFLFNLIICIVNCVVYLIPNQIIVLLCCLFNLIICQ
jgi:hypothetical protein